VIHGAQGVNATLTGAKQQHIRYGLRRRREMPVGAPCEM